MLIFYLVITCFAVIFFLIGFIVTIRDNGFDLASLALLFIGVLSALLLFATIDAVRRDNTQTTEYYFPAKHYKFEQVITETSETKYIGADTLVVVKRDTTYKLVGQDPIIGGDYHFNRKYPDTQ